MANTITVTYKINEDGSLQKIAQGAEKAAKSTNKATNASAQYNKQQKGVIGATSNSTKAFSKMTTGISSGLVPAYATLAANVFALTALFGALSRAASLRLLEEGLVRVGNAAGANLSVVSQKLKEITGNAISTESSMRSVALATSAGFSTKQLKDLTKVARGASIALGRDMSDAMDRLVRGTAKLEPEILDELGIMVRLDDATAEYAITLNKSVKDLTQYERRMAFLTATNDQGLKKFGELAESVSVNPYDKLAASFKNLSNIMINILNYAIEPLVNILSSNPMALLGAVTLFAGTLVSQIVPAITASAKAAQAMASGASKAAAALAAKTTAAFRNSAKAVSSFKFAPASLSTFESQLRKGQASAAGLKDAIAKLSATEIRRQKNLDAGALKNKAQKETEIAQIRQLKAELIALQKQEIAGGKAGGALGKAKGTSSTSRKTAAAFKMMEGAGPLQGFQIAAASVGKQSKDVIKAEGALNKLSLGFRVAGNSARLFGTALLNAIPFIGQLIMLGSILYPIISKLFEKDELAKAADKATESFDSFDGIGKQLKATLAGNITEAERFIATMRVQVGVVEQVSSAFSAMREEASKMNQEALVASKQKALDLQKELEKVTKKYTETGEAAYPPFQQHMANLQARLDGANAEHEALRTTIGLAREAEGILVLEDAIGKITNSETLKEELAGTLVGLEALKQKFIEANKEGGKGMSYDALIKETDALLGKNKEVIASVDAAKQVYNDFRKEITDLGDKGSHALDGVIKAQRNLTNEMTQSNASGGLGLDGFLKQVPELKKTLDNFRKEKKLSFVLNEAGVQAALTKHVEHQKDIMLEQVQIQKRLGVETSKVKEFAAGNQEATKILIGLEEEVRASKEKSLKAEKEAFTVLEMQETKKDRLAEIDRELAVIDRTRANSSIDTLRANIEGITHKQKLLDLTTQIAAAEKQIALDGMKRAENEARIAKMKTGRDFTPLDELKQFQATEKKRKQLIWEEMKSQLRAISLEQQLLIAQTKLQVERAKLVEAEINEARKARGEKPMEAGTLSQPFAELLDLFPKVFRSKMIAVISNARTQFSDLKFEKATKQSAVSNAALTASATGDTTAERIKNTQAAGDPAEGLEGTAVPLAKHMAFVNQLGPMIEELKSLGPEGEVVAALTEGTMAIQSAFLNMAHSISVGVTEGLNAAQMSATETVGKLQIAGAAVSMLSQALAAGSAAKIAGIDKEIAAEQKRDGNSAASVAKLAALDKKKEATARKAFNINKAMQIAQIAIATATAVMQLYTNPLDPAKIQATAMTPWIIGLGVAQAGIVASTSFQGGGVSSSGAGAAPSSISVGSRANTVDLATSKSASGELAYMRGESGTGSSASNFKPKSAFSGYRHRAAGGYIVGEQGPELFMPDRPGRVVPAGEVGNAGSAPVNVSFSIQTIDSQDMEQALIRQRGNIIGMIREAANNHGEFFLESINTQSYETGGGGRQYDGTSGLKSK